MVEYDVEGDVQRKPLGHEDAQHQLDGVVCTREVKACVCPQPLALAGVGRERL